MAAASGVVLLAASCAVGHPTMRGSGTLLGIVVSGPRCPGPERVDSPCPPGPVEGAVVAALSGRRVVASTKTDHGGRFRLALPPATYLIRATNVGGYLSTAEKPVVLSAGRSVSITLLLDTGIR